MNISLMNATLRQSLNRLAGKNIIALAVVSFFALGVMTLSEAQVSHHDQEWNASCGYFCHGNTVQSSSSVSWDFPDKYEISDMVYSFPVTVRLLDTTYTSWSIEVHAVGADPCGDIHQGYFWAVDSMYSGERWPADSSLSMLNMPIDPVLPDSGRKALFAWMRPWTPSGGLTLTLAATASGPSGDTTFILTLAVCERWEPDIGAMAGDINDDYKLSIGDVTMMIQLLFGEFSGNGPFCLPSDANGDCRLTIGDVTYMIDHLFRNSSEPVGCWWDDGWRCPE